MRRTVALLALLAVLGCSEETSVPLVPYSFQPVWRALPIPTPSTITKPPADFGRLAAGSIIPVFSPHSCYVSDDGWWLAMNGDVLIDLRRRSVVWRDENTSGSYASFDDRRLLRDDGVVMLDSARFFPFHHPDGICIRVVIPQAKPSWGVPACNDVDWHSPQQIANSSWVWMTQMPPATDAFNSSPRHQSAWIADLSTRRIITGLQTASPMATRNHDIDRRMVLGLLAQADLPKPLTAAMRTCGSVREFLQEIQGGRLYEYRLADDRLELALVPGAPYGMKRAYWSPSGTSVCTLHDGLVQTWTADWQLIARLPLLQASAHEGAPFGNPGYTVKLGERKLDVDCRTLQCAPAPEAQDTTGSQTPFAWVSPEGTFARYGKRRIPIAPSDLDWRQVRWTWQSDDLSLAAVLDQGGRVWVTQLPDGAPMLLGGQLPKPPFAFLAAPAKGLLLMLTESQILHIDVDKASVITSVPITGETAHTSRFLSKIPPSTRVGWRNGVQHQSLTAAHLRFDGKITAWPGARDLNNTYRFDLESGVISKLSLMDELRGVSDLGKWRVESLGDMLPDGRRIAKLRQAGIRVAVEAIIDPSGVRPTDFMPMSATDLSLRTQCYLGNRVWSGDRSDGGQLVWNAANGGWASLYPQSDGTVVAWSDDGYIAVPRRYADALSIGTGGMGIRCSAFDLQINRPDKVLERIGLADPTYVALLREAWEKRVRKLGLDPAKVIKPARYQDLPSVRLTTTPPGRTNAARIELACEIRTPSPVPVTVALRIGGLALGTWPIASGEKAGVAAKLIVPVDLHVGLNRIELIPFLADGSNGVPATAMVQRSGPAPRTRIATIGVSTYREPDRNLGFAAADALGLATAFANGSDRLVLTDHDVARPSIARIRSHLSVAETGDLAVISVAAHGLIDADGVYYIATHDTDFTEPQSRAIAVEDLLEALRASPARRRLLLLDTCHAGERDDPSQNALVASLPDGTARGLRPKVNSTPLPATAPPASAAAAKTQPARPPASVIARTMFLGSGWEDGITVLAACRGDEASWESPSWGHGAFSHAIINALGRERSRADGDGDGNIDLGELGAFVMAEVPRMTGGQQHPEIRSGELDRDILLPVPAP